MFGIDKLAYDSTDADTIAASDTIGSYILSDDGTNITHHTVASDQGLDVYIINTALDVNLQAGDGTDITQTGGALNVNISSADIGFNEEDIYAEDSAHTTADKGSFVLAVVQDTLAASADDGDYGAFKTNLKGELYSKDADVLSKLTDIETTIDNGIDVSDEGLANTALLNTAASSTTVSGALLGSQLANRKYLWVQNLGNVHVYVGASGVTTSTGLRMSPNAIAEFRFGPALSLHSVAQAGSQDMRMMEAS